MPPRLTPAPKPSPSASLSAQPRPTVRSPAGYAADAPIRQAPDARWSYIAYAVVVGVLLALPLLLSDFRLALVGKYLAFAVAAVGLDLLWGYAGVLSLGHGVFFSLGAYSMAMHMKLQSEELPDFMVWSGLEQLPWFWEPFRHFVVALADGGGDTRRVRHHRRLSHVPIGDPRRLLLHPHPGAGAGNDDPVHRPAAVHRRHQRHDQLPLRGPASRCTSSGVRLGLYLLTVVTLIGVVVLARWLVRTKTGTVLMAIRDGENRLRFLGYNPVRYKVVTFALSAAIAGFAGALFVPQVGIISPSSMGILPSVEMAVWVAVGGRGTIVGAAAGAVAVNWAKTVFSESLPEMWLYVFGALFIGVVLLFPRGLAGIAGQIRELPAVRSLRRRMAGPEPAPAASSATGANHSPPSPDGSGNGSTGNRPVAPAGSVDKDVRC